MAAYRKLTSIVVRSENLEEGNLYQYLSETWKNGVQKTDGPELRQIWEIVKLEKDGVDMMLALLTVLTGERLEYQLKAE